MKIIHLYEVKLVNGEIYRGEVVLRNKQGLYLRSNKNRMIYISYHSIMVMRDLGWRKLNRR